MNHPRNVFLMGTVKENLNINFLEVPFPAISSCTSNSIMIVVCLKKREMHETGARTEYHQSPRHLTKETGISKS
jgi:hypothetical protein